MAQKWREPAEATCALVGFVLTRGYCISLWLNDFVPCFCQCVVSTDPAETNRTYQKQYFTCMNRGQLPQKVHVSTGWMSRSQLPRTLTDTSLATWWPLIVAFPFSMASSGNWAHSCPPSAANFQIWCFHVFLPPMPYLQMGIHMVRPA